VVDSTRPRSGLLSFSGFYAQELSTQVNLDISVDAYAVFQGCGPSGSEPVGFVEEG